MPVPFPQKIARSSDSDSEKTKFVLLSTTNMVPLLQERRDIFDMPSQMSKPIIASKI